MKHAGHLLGVVAPYIHVMCFGDNVWQFLEIGFPSKFGSITGPSGRVSLFRMKTLQAARKALFRPFELKRVHLSSRQSSLSHIIVAIISCYSSSIADQCRHNAGSPWQSPVNQIEPENQKMIDLLNVTVSYANPFWLRRDKHHPTAHRARRPEAAADLPSNAAQVGLKFPKQGPIDWFSSAPLPAREFPSKSE